MTKFVIKLKSIPRDLRLAIGFSIFWYVALFPGRLGFDYSLAIRMIHLKQSTDQWTALYFWIIRLTTLNGRTIALISLISLVTLMVAIKYLINALPFSEKVQNRTYMYMSALPLVGAFGVNVSHDIFLASGIMILTSIHIRKSQGEVFATKKLILLQLFTNLLLLTSFEGMVVALANLIFIIVQKKALVAAVLAAFMISVQTLSGIGITKNPPSTKITFLVDDLKCVAQHPQAKITNEEWQYLTSLAPKSEWIKPISCSWPDAMYGSLLHLDKNRAVLNSLFIKNYLKIFIKNPLIVVESHLQRSRGALPPPIFQGPDNQVLTNSDLPVGYNTNTALQSGPEILHPSIDEPSVKVHLPFLKPIEFIAQASMFIFNQSSWFWGWGALWLWPAFVFLFIAVAKRKFLQTLVILSPVIVDHLTLVFIGPSPLPRYVMGATYVGLTISIAYLIDLTYRRDLSDNI